MDVREKTVTGMAEYIEREAAIKELMSDAPEQVGYSREDAADCIRYMDTADVAPVRHGRWMKAKNKKDYWGFDSDGDFGCWSDYPVLCSSCKYDATENSTGETNYCPNCGAIMDGGAD